MDESLSAENLLKVSVSVDVKNPDCVGRSGSLAPSGNANDRVARMDETLLDTEPESTLDPVVHVLHPVVLASGGVVDRKDSAMQMKLASDLNGSCDGDGRALRSVLGDEPDGLARRRHTDDGGGANVVGRVNGTHSSGVSDIHRDS